MWLDLTTSHRQTWLFSSTSTYHSTDLLTARGVAHLVVHGTKWLDQLRNDSTRPIGELWRGVRSTVDMVVQRRDGPRRLRDHDDDDEGRGGGWRSPLAARFRDFCSCFPLKRNRIRCLETSKYTGKSLSGWGPEHTALLKLSCWWRGV